VIYTYAATIKITKEFRVPGFDKWKGRFGNSFSHLIPEMPQYTLALPSVTIAYE